MVLNVSGDIYEQREKVCPCCISETVRLGLTSSSYLVGTLVRGCRCATSWCDIDLTFNLTVVTLTYKFMFGYILETISLRKLILGRDIGGVL